MLKDMDFYHLKEILLTNIKSIIGYRTRFFINCFQKNLVHETSEFLGNKIADGVTDLYENKIVKTKPVEEIIIQSEK